MLTHSPAQIIRDLLVDLGLGVLPSAGGNWPLFVTSIPDSPDSIITITDTLGTSDGRIQPTGEAAEHPGFQVAVRDSNHQDGWEKANAIRVALSETVASNSVSITDNVGTGTSEYVVFAVTKIGGIIVLGKELPTSKRHLFTINATVALRQTT